VTEVTDRTFWTTREAADECGLTETTLRWYERIGLLDRVERGTDLRRRFTQADLNWLVLISRLRATGMPVREMLRYAELARRDGTERERLEIFEAHRRRITAALAVQQECLAVLDHKIDIYRRALPTEQPATTEDTTCAPHSSAN
jgi:DNA-binding transcriptional MerR regulator